MCAIFPQRRSVGPEQLHGICRYFLQPFVRPEIDILENDFLVISRLGKVIEALAGAAERQPSHNNVPVRLDDPVV